MEFADWVLCSSVPLFDVLFGSARAAGSALRGRALNRIKARTRVVVRPLVAAHIAFSFVVLFVGAVPAVRECFGRSWFDPAPGLQRTPRRTPCAGVPRGLASWNSSNNSGSTRPLSLLFHRSGLNKSVRTGSTLGHAPVLQSHRGFSTNPLVAGKVELRDRAELSTVGIVNESFARRYFRWRSATVLRVGEAPLCCPEVIARHGATAASRGPQRSMTPTAQNAPASNDRLRWSRWRRCVNKSGRCRFRLADAPAVDVTTTFTDAPWRSVRVSLWCERPGDWESDSSLHRASRPGIDSPPRERRLGVGSADVRMTL